MASDREIVGAPHSSRTGCPQGYRRRFARRTLDDACLPCPMPSPTVFLRLALDPVRLAVLGHAAAGPVDTAVLAASLGVAERDVLRAVGRLREAGLLTPALELDRAVLRRVSEALPTAEPVSSVVTEGSWSAEEREVLARFFEGSRLTQIPSQRTKRLVVLERLAQAFEPGLRYSERTVNGILQTFHEDYAALRRYLVDEGLLTRAEGVYWRSGGRFEPAAD